MEKLRVFLAVSVFTLLVAACGGGGSSSTTSNETPAQPVSVSLSELSATIEISTTHQFSATVENADDESVDWQVNKTTGGSSTVGTISDSGLYTAPDHVPSPITVTVTAVSHADATKEASATVTIMSNVTVSVSPEEGTLPAGETLQLTAAIENAKDTAAKWAVNDVAGGNATLGTISSGLYTAPSLPPPGGVVTITAISLADTSKTDSVSVTVQFSNASLNGPYVFSLSGNTEGGPFYEAGHFVSDGNGNITNGVEDYRQAGITSLRTFAGTYDIVPTRQGRVIANLNFTGPGGTASASFWFELTNKGEGPMLSLNNFMTGSGQIYKQDADTFSTASMNGSYVMQALGAEPSGTLAGVGVITSDGAGNFTGVQDVNDNGNLITKMSFNGTYSIDANGRAVVTTATGSETSETALYLISSDRAVGVPLNAGSGGGLYWMEKQQLTTFSNASASGDYVFFNMGDAATDNNITVGRETLDGAGTITGVSDHNAGGVLASQNNPFTGTYSIPATDMGRGTAEGTIFYLVSEKKAFLIGTDRNVGGQVVAQEGVPFSTSSLQGTYVFSLRGFKGVEESGALGHLTLDGNGAVTGNEAENWAGTLTPNQAVSGTYSVGENGRGQLTMTVGGMEFTYTLYVVDSSHAFLLEMDTSGVARFGSMVAQFPAQQVPLVGTTL